MLRAMVTVLRGRSGKYRLPFAVGYRKESDIKLGSEDDASTNSDIKKIEDEVKKSNCRVSPKIIAELTAKGCELHKIPIGLLKEKFSINNLYLIDKAVADQFASLIIPDLKKANSQVFEVNPGLGYLTEKLLEAGVCRIQLFENNLKAFAQSLTPLTTKYSHRLSVTSHDFFKLSKIICIDYAMNTNVFKSIMQNVSKCKWDDEPSLYIIGALAQKNFLYYLRHALISGELSDYGRIALYLAIAPSILMLFGETKKTKFHTPNNVFLHLFFDYKTLITLPRCAFLPWLNNKRKFKYYSGDNKLIHVVKLVPKLDFLSDNFTKSDAEMFYYFLYLNLKPSQLRVIPALEKWIPNCGPRLIKKNLDIFTQFKQLSASELLNLFKTFKSWPEYENSPFFNIVEDLKSR